MNIPQLETFHWISQLGTFSAAAERLCTSQAAVSARIKELESELDVVLFNRIGRHVQLTLKGRELLVHAKKVISDAAQLRMAAGRSEMLQGVLKMGVGEVIAWRSMVPLFNGVKQRYPGLDIGFHVDLNTNLLRMLSRGEIDIAVVGGPIEEPDIHCKSIGAMKLSWVGSPELLRRGTEARPEDVAALPIISLGPGARLHTQMYSWFSEGGVSPSTVSYCNSVSTMLQAVRAGIFICMAPEELLAADIEAERLVALTAQPELPPLSFFVATRSESVDPALDDIANLVSQVTCLPDMAALKKPRPGKGGSPTP